MKRHTTVLALLVLAMGLVVAPAAAQGPGDHGPPDGVPPVETPPPATPPVATPPADPPAHSSGTGLTADRLAAAGWHCFDPDGEGPLGMHCVPPGSPLHPDSKTAGKARASLALVFDATTGEFVGTELLRFTDADLAELPCPKDGGHWHDLGDMWACHHSKGKPIPL